MTKLLVAVFLLVLSPAVHAAPGVAMRVLQLPSDPPGQAKEAPGGGRVTTPAVLFTPASGENAYGPAIVMLSTGPGAHPLEAGQASRFAAERLAARGYTVISLYGKLEHDFATVPFASSVWAVKAALDWLEMAGHEDFVLVGQDYGAIVAANYLATQPDLLLDNGGERRVKAVVLVNPTVNLRAFPRAGLSGPDYLARVANAEAAVKSGTGGYPGTLEPGQRGADWVGNGVFVQPAEAFMQLWSPAAETRNKALLAKVALPTLALISATYPATSARLTLGVTPDVVRFPGDKGSFTGSEDRATTAIADWLARRGLAPRAAVREDVLDVATSGGRILQGVRYAPAKVDPKRPVVVLISGRVGDTIQSSTDWIGRRFAQAGYVAIAPGMRISGVAGFQSSRLTEVVEDIGKWIDKTAALGATRIVLAGHSNGGIWLSRYIADTKDKRIVGTIYIAPTRDSPTYARDHSPPGQYDKDVAAARAAAAAGRDMDVGIGFMSARAFLDNNAPDARTVHTEAVRQFSVPGLSITGAKDPLMSEDFVRDFSAAYKGQLDTIRYPNGTHGFRENKDRIVADMAAWLGKTFP